ncbi:MAG: flagellar export protein FliJ, partial [Armatimonadota bacterium]
SYHFSLQTALELRKRKEELAQRQLSRAQRMVRDRTSDLERTRQRHDAIAAGLRGSSDGPGAQVKLGEIEHTLLVLSDLRRRMIDQQRRLQDAERECEIRRTELVEASRAFRTLERLSERREAEFLHAEMLREQRELNEAAISRHRAAGETGFGASLTRDLDSVA